MMRSYRIASTGPQEERRLSPKITTGEEAAHQQKNMSERDTAESSCSDGEIHLPSLSPVLTHSSKPRVFTHYALPLSPEETRKPFSAQAMNILGFEGHNSSVSYPTLFFNYPLKM